MLCVIENIQYNIPQIHIEFGNILQNTLRPIKQCYVDVNGTW